MNNRHVLRVIPEPGGERSVFAPGDGWEGSIYFRGPDNEPPCVCGACETELITGIDGNFIVDIVLQCSRCGAFNESLASSMDALRGRWINDPVITIPPGRFRTCEVGVPKGNIVWISERAMYQFEQSGDTAFNA